MGLLILFLLVPAALLVWRLCAVGADADERMARAFHEMMMEKQKNAPPAVKEDDHAR